MARRFDRDTLKRGMSLRQRFFSALQTFQLKQAAHTAQELEAVGHDYHDFAAHLGDIEEARYAEDFADAIDVAAHVCRWTIATLEAIPDAQRFFGAAKARCVLLQERLSGQASVTVTDTALSAWAGDVLSLQEISQVAATMTALGRIRLPVCYSYSTKKREHSVHEETPDQETKQVKAVVVKLMFSLDGQILTTPQAIRSMMQHDLTVALVAATWPQAYDTLRVDFLSTIAPDSYYLTPFSFSRSNGDRQTQKGHCIFHHAQTLLSEPAVIKVHARFVSTNGAQTHTITVVGHSELKLRVLNEASYPVLTGYSTVDIQIPKILARLYPSSGQKGRFHNSCQNLSRRIVMR